MKIPPQFLEKGLTQEHWDNIVEFPMAQMKASLILSNLISEIKTNGGSIQRSEGIKLLKRIQKRYSEDFNRRCEDRYE